MRTNEYYVSQYLDLTPVEMAGHGTAVAVRQNMPGPTPWLLVGCLGTGPPLGHRRGPADRARPGRGRAVAGPDAPSCPATRLQGEHSAVALQTEPVVLAPGATWTTGFFGVFRADHPEATSADDARHAEAALADPAARSPRPPAAH